MLQFAKSIFCAVTIISMAGVLQLPTEAQSLHLKRRTLSDAKQLEPEEMLSDLRDFRLCLKQLKQQAVNIFQEATRTVITLDDTPIETTPSEINASMLDEKKTYMPPRKEWLVFSVNTVEPIIQLLIEDVNDVDTNGRKAPDQIETRINPLWKTWRQDVDAINKTVDEIQNLIGSDSGTNVALAKASIALYNKAEELEKVRYKAAIIFREEFTKMKNEKNKAPGEAKK